MAMQVEPILVGVDVSKAELVISIDGATPETLDNEPCAIRRWLKALQGPACLAMEATSTFHLALADEAHRQGHSVYLINGYRLNRYREGIGGRAKTDPADARLLVRYLQRERADLRPWSPPSKAYRTLMQLLHRRATLVQARVAIQQSLQGLSILKSSLQALTRQLARVDALIQRRIQAALASAGWQDPYRRCQAIEGIGPVTAAALTTLFQRGHFRHSDAFIAFIGLDVRVRDSGTHRGRRKLTKQGDPELRRLLYLAAMQAKRQPAWRDFYQRHLDRGLQPIQALNVLARKLARVAFALMKNETEYAPRIA